MKFIKIGNDLINLGQIATIEQGKKNPNLVFFFSPLGMQLYVAELLDSEIDKNSYQAFLKKIKHCATSDSDEPTQIHAKKHETKGIESQ